MYQLQGTNLTVKVNSTNQISELDNKHNTHTKSDNDNQSSWAADESKSKVLPSSRRQIQAEREKRQDNLSMRFFYKEATLREEAINEEIDDKLSLELSLDSKLTLRVHCYCQISYQYRKRKCFNRLKLQTFF